MSLYIVCESLQHDEIDRFCFGDCGKIKVGAVIYNNLTWFPCKQSECKHKEREVDADQSLDGEQLILRKLAQQ